MIAFSLIVFHAIVVPVFPWVGAGRTLKHPLIFGGS